MPPANLRILHAHRYGQSQRSRLREPDSAPDTGDLALAWQSMVTSGMTMAQPQTENLLRAAPRESPGDPAVLVALAYTAQQRGNLSQAASLYQKTLAIDRNSLR